MKKEDMDWLLGTLPGPAIYEETDDELCCDVYTCRNCNCDYKIYTPSGVRPHFCTWCGADLRTDLRSGVAAYANELYAISATLPSGPCCGCGKRASGDANVCIRCQAEKMKEASAVITILADLIEEQRPCTTGAPAERHL